MVETDFMLIIMASITITTLLFCGRHFVKSDRLNKRYKAERDAAEKACKRWKVRYERDTGRKVLREGE